MTDEQVVKGLEVCSASDWTCGTGCPYRELSAPRCLCELTGCAHDLINRQKTEIETLKKERLQSEQDADILETILDDKNKDISDLIFKERNNAILEFVEQLKDKADQDDCGEEFVLVYDIDKTVEEMGVEE